MTLGFILNGEDVIVQSNAENRLVDILRKNFNLLGTKGGCYLGDCGSCSVIFNGEVVKSCLIPVFKIRNSEIITIEGFSQTDEYQDIVLGFSEAGLENCDYCNNAKILATEALLDRNKQPTREEILTGFHGIKCRCTEPDELIHGIMKVLERRRHYG
jgi:carbon-monoxide dehydrogenase small subunit